MEQKQRQHLAGGVPARVCTWMCTSLASGSRRVKTCGCRWPFLSGAAMPMARVPLGCSFTCQTGSSTVQHLSPCHAVQVCSIHQGYQCKPTVKVVPCKNSEQGVAFFPCNAAGLHLLHALELLAGRRLESSHHLVPCNLACMSAAQPGSAGRRADSIAPALQRMIVTIGGAMIHYWAGWHSQCTAMFVPRHQHAPLVQRHALQDLSSQPTSVAE